MGADHQRLRGVGSGERPRPDEGDKVLYVFDGGELAAGDLAAVRLAPTELAEYAFHTVGEATSALVPRLARRIAAAVRAHREGLTSTWSMAKNRTTADRGSGTHGAVKGRRVSCEGAE